jgi:outer membrane receptor protein involved in Fe transport
MTTRLRGCVSRLALAMGYVAGGEVLAQPTPEDDVIVVTGTRIPRKDIAAASPVASFDRGEITEFGATVLEDFVNTLPQIKPDFGKTSNNPGDGTSSIDLRGLGSGRTLVLLNGRRVAPSGTGSAIDVNVIPGAMIERVEIVSGGTSAVYGSDAVTGAVNFITRKNFTGIELSSQADVYGAGDGAVYNASIVGGLDFADGRGHVAVFGDFLKRKPVFQGDREFTETTLLEFGGALAPAGSPSVPAGRTTSGGSSLIFNPDGTVRPFSPPADLYNFAPANYLQTPLTRWSAGAFAEFEASEAIDLYAEIMYARPSVERELAPPPASFTAPLVINGPFFPASTRAILTTRYDPDGDGLGTVRISKRFEDTGPRILTTEREYWRGVLGFKARIAPAWNLDTFYSYARNDNSEGLDNAVSLSRVLQGLRINPVTGACTDPSNGCVAVNIFGDGNISPAAQDFIRVTGLANAYSTVQHNAAAVATGDLFSWSEGTVQAAVGVEFRRNIASAQADPALATGDALGFNSFAGAEGAINVYEAFSELLVPLLEDEPFAERLEIEGGGRYSHYSTAGGVWTWKAGGQWVPFRGLRFSGMWQRAVRAPNVQELFEVLVRSTSFDADLSDVDFCAARNDPVGSGLAAVCIAQGMSPAAIGVFDLTPGFASTFDTVGGGNPDLAVERAGSITAGFDYTFDLPVSLAIGADYFSISIEDAISIPDFPLTECAVVADAGAPVCQATTRAPSGEIVEMSFQPINVGVARARGVDMTLDFAADLPSSFGLGEARLALRSAAAVYFDIGEAQTSNSPFIDCAGFYAVGCGAGFAASLPKYQVTNAFSLEKGAFTGSLRWRWMSGADNLAPVLGALAGLPPSPDTAIFSIPGKHYVDLSAVYELFGGVTLRAGVDNVFKTKPPLLGDQQVQANTDPSRYDVFGRRFFVGVDVRLWRD